MSLDDSKVAKGFELTGSFPSPREAGEGARAKRGRERAAKPKSPSRRFAATLSRKREGERADGPLAPADQCAGRMTACFTSRPAQRASSQARSASRFHVGFEGTGWWSLAKIVAAVYGSSLWRAMSLARQ